MARSVEDAALLYRVLNGPDPEDPATLAWTADDPLPSLRRGVAGLRLALLPEAEREGVDEEVLAAYDAALETLREAGRGDRGATLPHRFRDYAAATGRIIGSEGYRFVGHLVDDASLPVDPHVRPRIQLGRGVSARDYLLALAEREAHRKAFATATAGVDALLTPTTQTPAIPVDAVDQTGTPAHFTRPGNYLGMCAWRCRTVHRGRAAHVAADRCARAARKRWHCASRGRTSKPRRGASGGRRSPERARGAHGLRRVRGHRRGRAGPRVPLRAARGRSRLPSGGRRVLVRAGARHVQAHRDRYAAAGYGHGHRVAILMENRPEFFFHYLALNALGVGVVPVNPDYRHDELPTRSTTPRRTSPSSIPAPRRRSRGGGARAGDSRCPSWTRRTWSARCRVRAGAARAARPGSTPSAACSTPRAPRGARRAAC